MNFLNRFKAGWERSIAGGLAAAALVWVPAAVHAERIETVDGRVFGGKVLMRQQVPGRGEIVTIKVGSTTIALPASQIRSIRPSTPAEDALLAARSACAEGRFGDVAPAMDKALSGGEPPATLVALIRANADALAVAAAKAPPDARAALSRVVAKLQQSPAGQGSDLLPIWLDLHMALGEQAAADAIFKKVGPSVFDGAPARRARIAAALGRALDADVTQGQFANGPTLLDDLTKVDPTLAADRRTQFFLQWAWDARKKGDFEHALQIYLRYVYDEAPMVARDRMKVALREAEAAYRSRGDLPGLARLYEVYVLPQMPDLAKPRLVQIWRDAGWQHLRAGEYPQARECFGRAEQFGPGSTKNDMLQVEYRERRDRLAPRDPVGHFNLGVWCQEKKLWANALTEYQTAQAQGVSSDQTRDPIAQVEAKIAEAALLKIMDEYQAGHYSEALAAVNRFLEEKHPLGYMTQARDVRKLTMEAIRLRMDERPQQAEGLYQRAERAFNLQQYAECQALLNTILNQYGDTVVAGQARTFYAAVRDKLALASLEKGQAPAGFGPDTHPSNTPTTTTREIERIVHGLGRMDHP